MSFVIYVGTLPKRLVSALFPAMPPECRTIYICREGSETMANRRYKLYSINSDITPY